MRKRRATTGNVLILIKVKKRVKKGDTGHATEGDGFILGNQIGRAVNT